MKWLGKIAVAVSACLLLFAILEVGARVYARVMSQDRLIIADKVVGWKLIPNARKIYRKETQPYFVSTNSKGLRDEEHSYEKPAGIYRIVAIGDSFVFGSGGVAARNRFTGIMERSTKNVEVINMGVPAYGADQEYLYLKEEGLKYHPDLILLCAFYNDFGESFSTVNPSIGRPKGYFSLNGNELLFHPPSFSIFYRLSQQSYLLGIADAGLRKISGKYWQAQHRNHAVLDRPTQLATFRQIYATAAELCRQHGVKFVVVYFPFRGQNVPMVIQQVLADLATSQGMKTLDLMDTMLKADAVQPAYFSHDIHFNEYGHAVVAKALLQYLTDNSYINPGPVQAFR